MAVSTASSISPDPRLGREPEPEHADGSVGEGVGRGAEGTSPAGWLELHGDALWRYAVSRLGAAAEAEDAVQETLLAALGATKEFRGESQERTWLIGILRHKVSDIRRKQRRTTSFDPYDVFNKRGRWQNKPSRWPLSAKAARTRGEIETEVLEGCLERLPAVLAEAFWLRETRGFSTASIATEQGASENSVRVRLHRAREALRRCLTARWATTEKTDPDGGSR